MTRMRGLIEALKTSTGDVLLESTGTYGEIAGDRLDRVAREALREMVSASIDAIKRRFQGRAAGKLGTIAKVQVAPMQTGLGRGRTLAFEFSNGDKGFLSLYVDVLIEPDVHMSFDLDGQRPTLQGSERPMDLDVDGVMQFIERALKKL